MRKKYWAIAAVAAVTEVLLLGIGIMSMLPARSGVADFSVDTRIKLEAEGEQGWRNGYW